MADYKQTNIAGQQWNRFSRVVIENPRGAAPSVNCVEQEVIALAAGEVIRDIGNMRFQFESGYKFPLLNPQTNEPTGVTGSGAEVYALIYSYVMAQATARDARQAAVAAPVAAT